MPSPPSPDEDSGELTPLVPPEEIETRSISSEFDVPRDETGDETGERTQDSPADEATSEERRGSMPSRIGRYLVIDHLGEGGMGLVYEAFDPELDRRVALKLLRSERADGDGRLRLIREAQAMARLSHPNVVQVYDVGVDGGQVFMAMELVRGQTLRGWLKQTRRAWPEIVAQYVSAGRGLQAAHDAGIIHRDFKPHNVLVGDDGRVRVADFGLAGAESPSLRPTRPGDGPSARSYLSTSLTSTGTVMGTPRYMAPEQHRGQDVGPAADQFALCVALYEALFEQHPFGGRTVTELMTNVLDGDIVEPEDASSVPRWLLSAIRRGLARDPTGRHASVERLLQLLEREPAQRRRRRTIAAVAGTAVGLSALATIGLVARGDEPCTGGADAIAEVWSEARHDEVSTALEGSEGAPVVLRTLDAYAERWAESHQSVCLEHHDAAMSSSIFDAAMGCLQRGRAALDGVTQTVATGDARVVEAAAKAAAGLPALSRCRDTERLRLDVEPPSDPAQAAAVATLRERLARVEAVHGAGALESALEELAAIEGETTALRYGPLLAERALVSARLAMDRFEWQRAQRELSEATASALGSGVDVVAAEAAARKLFVDVMQHGPEAHDVHEEAVAQALVERVGAPPDLAALLSNNIGVVRVMGGDREAAVRSFGRALALADEAEDVNPVDHAGYVINLAVGTADPVARDALFERAHQMAEASLGSGHERSVEIEMLRARHTVDPAEAAGRLAGVCERASANLPMQWARCHVCHSRLAELHEQTEDDAAAQQALTQAKHCLSSAGPQPDGSETAFEIESQTAMIEGYAAVLSGEHESALARLQPLRERLEPYRGRPWMALDLAMVTLLQARSLHALGRGAEAIEPLGDAIEIFEQESTRSEDRAAHERGERARALLAEIQAQR